MPEIRRVFRALVRPDAGQEPHAAYQEPEEQRYGALRNDHNLEQPNGPVEAMMRGKKRPEAEEVAEKAKRRRSGDSIAPIYMQLIACRVPRADHDALRCVSKRWRSAAERVGLQRLRAVSGWTETRLIVAGGGDSVYERGDSDPTPDREETWALIGGRWRAMCAQPAPRCDGAVVSWRGRVVCVGGTRTVKNDADEWTMKTGVSDVVTYDAATDTWAELPAKIDARTSAYAAVDPLTDSLVVVGGWRVVGDFLDAAHANQQVFPDEEVGSMQMLANPTDAAWTALPPPPYPVSNFAAGVIGSSLYVAGGLCWGSNGWRMPSDTLQVFDFGTRTWSLGPPMPAARYYGAGCACLGKLYIVGGKDASRQLTREVYVFDAASGEWSRGLKLPFDRYYHSCIEHRGKLVVFGGEGPPLVLSSLTGNDPGLHPPEEQLWSSRMSTNQLKDFLGRALASDDSFSVPAASLSKLTVHTLQRFGFDPYDGDEDDHGATLRLTNRRRPSALYKRLQDAPPCVPRLPAGHDHPLLAAIVCSAPVG